MREDSGYGVLLMGSPSRPSLNAVDAAVDQPTSVTQNLRREARVDVRVPVVVLRGKNAIALETSDVSFKGLFLCTAEPPPLRSLVRLKVALYDRELEAHAMAVHVVEGAARAGVGLQFWGLSGADRTAWDDFVRGLAHARRVAAKARLAAAQATPSPSEPPGLWDALSEAPSGVHAILPKP